MSEPLFSNTEIEEFEQEFDRINGEENNQNTEDPGTSHQNEDTEIPLNNDGDLGNNLDTEIYENFDSEIVQDEEEPIDDEEEIIEDSEMVDVDDLENPEDYGETLSEFNVK